MTARTGYDAYLASPAWRSLRAAALARDGNRCRLCDSPEALEAHHRRYPPPGRWDLEGLDALTTLCRTCHELATDGIRGRRHARTRCPVPGDVVRVTPVPGPGSADGQLPVAALQDHQRLSPAHAQRPAD